MKGNWSVPKWTMILQLHWSNQLAFPRGQSVLPYIYKMYISQSNWLKEDSVCRYYSESRTSLWRHQFLLGLVVQLKDLLLAGGRQGGRNDLPGMAVPYPRRESSAILIPSWEWRELYEARQGGWGLQGMLCKKDEGWGEDRKVYLCKDSVFALLV